jgi:membrane-bound serine protease (ClpP class)
VRRLGLFLLFIALPLVALAQDEGGGIDVIDVSGPLDASALAFMADSIEESADSGQELIVLQVNSKAVLDSDEFERLSGLIESPPLPLAVWVGPAPAAAFGGIGEVVLTAQEAAIAPGSTIGLPRPSVLGVDDSRSDEVFDAEDTGLELQPTLRQYLQDLDGRTVDTASGPVTLSTIRDFEGGVTVKQVTFKKPGLATRFFRLAVSPEAAFFFLVVGLSMVTFEFFALGPGVAAGVAAISLLLGGWGVLTLPTRPWALGLTIIGWVVLTAAYQRGGLVLMTVLGTALLQIGGTFFIDGAGQIDPRWWLVLPSVLAVLFFFMIAMPTVQRARLSTQTVGRDTLVGLTGIALTDFEPEGLVEVKGARWQATAHREAGIIEGSPVLVTGLDGLYLEVEAVRPA